MNNICYLTVKRTTMGKMIQVAQAWTIAAKAGEEVLLGYRDIDSSYLYTNSVDAMFSADRLNKQHLTKITQQWQPHKTIIRVMED